MQRLKILVSIICFSIIFIANDIFASSTIDQAENKYQSKNYLKAPKWLDPNSQHSFYKDVLLNKISFYKEPRTKISDSSLIDLSLSESYLKQTEDFEKLNSYIGRQFEYFEDLRFNAFSEFLLNQDITEENFYLEESLQKLNIPSIKSKKDQSEILMNNLRKTWEITHQAIFPFLAKGCKAFLDINIEDRFYEARSHFNQTCFDILDFVNEIEKNTQAQYRENIKWLITLIDFLPSGHPFFTLNPNFYTGKDFYSGNILYNLEDLIFIAEKYAFQLRITNDLKKRAEDFAEQQWRDQEENQKLQNKRNKRSFKTEIIINYILGSDSQKVISEWVKAAANIRTQKQNQSNSNKDKSRLLRS